MSALTTLLDTFRNAAVTEREKGTYFEELTVCYLRTEPSYADLYDGVWTYGEWATDLGLTSKDTGIDLVARTRGTGEFHAIQCKLYAADHVIAKKDIDSFFTASGKTHFTRRLIIASTNHWTENAEASLDNQNPPVSKIDLFDLDSSLIDWTRYQPKTPPALRPRKTPRPHQKTAIERVLRGFETQERGKLIMACGTGKTFTSLKITEAQAGRGGRVLFLVPSLSLLSQTLTEWTQESRTPLHSFAVCSDSDVGKKSADDDEIKIKTHELRYPATTSAARLAEEFSKRHDDSHMSVVFSTYHSIDVIARAQDAYGMPDFDLVICDEAHRTTGVTFPGDGDGSAFVRVHDQDYLHARRRLYMTATPRIYGDVAKEKAGKEGALVCSMNDEAIYGHDLHVITFSEAVRRKLLVDYKVIVLAVEEKAISATLQKLLDDSGNGLKVDDAAKIVGCWKALAKIGLSQDGVNDPAPMKRAVAFCQVIAPEYRGKKHKVSSIRIAEMFQQVVEEYQKQEDIEPQARLTCEAEHVDGGMNASEKEAKLAWLKEEAPEQTCRILSNVRCLSEGVDVPALDAVLFLTPRNSQVDVVQSVGRVMRAALGKTRGYVVLPVVIPAGKEPHEALDDNQTYRVVWEVLQALRSHDDRFDAMVNKMDLREQPDTSRMEVIAITHKITQRTIASSTGLTSRARKTYGIGTVRGPDGDDGQEELQLQIGEIERAIYARIVKKVGNRHHWEDWANDIAKIAGTHIARIETILDNPENTKSHEAFSRFAAELRADLNDSVTDGEIIEMLAQHLITRPVFEALFAGHSFAADNPISKALSRVLDVLDEHSLGKETDTLDAFYRSVHERAEGIDTAYGRQKIMVELYDRFFRSAFPKMTERLGIVYTPVEVVDFIIRSVNDVLEDEFDQTLGSPGVHILDPFTGTGTFITRLLQSGFITKDELAHKYRHEIHANEIVLLAYYIAAINIEAAYHDLMKGDYMPFEGICLTDTFRLNEGHDLASRLLADNNARVRHQQTLDIRVIMGNPPYSVGQKSENDNNDNVEYPALDQRIRNTYAARSNAMLAKGLYDSYVRSIRWASDRIRDRGVIGFVTNAGFLDANTADGLRKCLAEEFSSLHIFHLRGNQRTAGETSRREGGKIFGAGSRAPIAISILVKNPESAKQGEILFHDIGDYLTREQKLARVMEFGSIRGIRDAGLWTKITPDAHGDWLRQRDDNFANFIPLGAKKGESTPLFENFSLGVVTNRDVWCWDPSRDTLARNMREMIGFYEHERARFNAAFPDLPRKAREAAIDKFIDTDPTKISWTHNLKQELARDRELQFEDCLVPAIYRPFSRQWLYFSRRLNERVYQMPRIFPIDKAEAENQVIMIKQRPHKNSQFALMSKCIPELQSDGGTQCFPEYLYEIDSAEQSRAEQSRAEQSRAEQNYTRQLTEDQEKNLVICTSGGGQKAAFSVLMCSALPSLHMVDIDGSQCFPMFLYETEHGQ
jgi:predicted helicase